MQGPTWSWRACTTKCMIDPSLNPTLKFHLITQGAVWVWWPAPPSMCSTLHPKL